MAVMKKNSILASTALLIPFISMAHEGHGTTDGYTITHYFVEPEHAVFTWSILLVTFFLLSVNRLKKKRLGK